MDDQGIISDRFQDEDEEIWQLVCFMFADEQYAVDIKDVQEVIRVQKITYVPQMPDFVLGVINIRGNIIPVFDLRRKFGLRENVFNDNTKMIVVDIDASKICFIVDEILDNIKIGASRVVPAPNVKMKVKRECIQGIGRLEGRMIIVLDLKELHNSILEDIKELTSRESLPDSRPSGA